MVLPDIYEPFRAMMRSRWGYCGPYRLGIAIGEHGGGLGPPPHYREQSIRTFNAGVEAGLRSRAKKEGKTT